MALDGSVLLHNSLGHLETKLLRDVAIGLHRELATGERYDLPVMLVGAISHVCELWFEFLSATLKVACVKVVFDGQHTEGKKDEREKRMKERTTMYQKAMYGKDGEGNALAEKDYRSALVSSLFLTWNMYKVAIGTFTSLGAMCLVAIGEADSQIVHMCLNGEADFAIFGDGDLFVHGVPLALVGIRPGVLVEGRHAFHGACWVKLANASAAYTKTWYDYDVYGTDGLLLHTILSGCDYLLGGVVGCGAKAKAVNVVKFVWEENSKEGARHRVGSEEWLNIVGVVCGRNSLTSAM